MKPIPTMALALIGVAIGVASSRALNTLPQPGNTQPTQMHQTTMSTADTSRRLSASGHDITPLSTEKRNTLAAKLTPEEARVLLNDGTEPAFCGNLVDNKKDGVYLCKLCSLPLFASNAKFDSGTGWPSFFQPVDKDHIHETKDTAYGMVRTEISCARCDGHLGHVFDDAPQTKTGLRYCLNSVSLEFIENGQPMPEAARPVADQKNAAKSPNNAANTPANLETAYFAGGCFWGVEDRFQQLPGVKTAISGYMGGELKNPTYKQVCNGNTGHAETVKVVYDPAVITYPQLLEWFFKFHNPTQLNRQGPDIGTQYRSAIFANTDAQLQQAKDFLAAQANNPRFQGRKVVTQLDPVAKAGEFYEAEEYHQDYHLKHGGSCALPDL